MKFLSFLLLFISQLSIADILECDVKKADGFVQAHYSIEIQPSSNRFSSTIFNSSNYSVKVRIENDKLHLVLNNRSGKVILWRFPTEDKEAWIETELKSKIEQPTFDYSFYCSLNSSSNAVDDSLEIKKENENENPVLNTESNGIKE